ncbi:hypothetical protein HDU93_003906 [Gonapodya sp. JEL0774]|nr:hypothetical protein HDU93_003906 [Gonapodya sp. JEL0774]
MVPSLVITPAQEMPLPYPGGEIAHGKFGDWQLSPKVLGAGSFATVRKCEEIRTGLKAVAKSSTIAPDSHANHRLYVLRELATLTHLTAVPHPNIVKIYDAVLVGETVHIIQERVEGMELFDYLKQQGGHLPVHHVRYITAQLLSALHFMHSHHVLHRDIKLDNVLIDPATLHVTIIDFNLSTFYTDSSELVEPVGCINYSSPQILEAAYGRPYKAHMGWSDLWALGVTVYGMLCGFFPFRSEHARKLYAEHTALREKPVPFVGETPIHPAAQAFVRRILSLDSFGRISAATLLSDPFITGAAFTEGRPADIEALVAQTLRTAVAYSRIAHPYDPVVMSMPDLVSRDLAVQETSIRFFLHSMSPGTTRPHLTVDCGLGTVLKPPSSSSTNRRRASEDTVHGDDGYDDTRSEVTVDDLSHHTEHSHTGTNSYHAADDYVPSPTTATEADPPAPLSYPPAPPVQVIITAPQPAGRRSRARAGRADWEEIMVAS